MGQLETAFGAEVDLGLIGDRGHQRVEGVDQRLADQQPGLGDQQQRGRGGFLAVEIGLHRDQPVLRVLVGRDLRRGA
jgi:hypothetical protein